MAAVAPSSDQTSELLQNLSLDSKPKGLEVQEPTKKTSVYQYGAVDSANDQISQGDRSITPYLQDSMDPSILYHPYPSPYYYGGYPGSETSWDDYSRFGTDGVDMSSGVYADNGSVLYGGYGYAPYAPHSPTPSLVPTMGNDGQLYGPQQYQYPPYFQPLTQTTPPLSSNPNVPSQTELPTSTTNDQKPLPSETSNTNSSRSANGSVLKANGNSTPYKPKYRNSINFANGYDRGNYQDSRYGYDGQYKNSGSKVNNSSRNQNYRQNSYMGLQPTSTMAGMGTNPNFLNRIYPSKYYGDVFSMGYGSTGYDSSLNYKNKARGNGYYTYRSENDFGMNEMNRGPRGKGPKYPKSSTQITNGVVSDKEEDEALVIPDRDQYNKPDFSEVYPDAKFYVIKSYSEDDVHKSIKYKVWASTPTGNKKLDAAYSEAQLKPNCPVFLFFSVNASGQFVGLAEMMGPVDFEKNVEYWQQDKWTGCFPVKWHIVKDVPNSMLKHITLENNENKPVTNSRDTQEVKMEQGLKMLKVFKEHSSKTCILDDFEFYEIRQKCIQSKKAKQLLYRKAEGDDKNGVVEVDSGKEGTEGVGCGP